MRGCGAVLEGEVWRGRKVGYRAEGLVGMRVGFGGMGGWTDVRGGNRWGGVASVQILISCLDFLRFSDVGVRS